MIKGGLSSGDVALMVCYIHDCVKADLCCVCFRSMSCLCWKPSLERQSPSLSAT